MSEELKPEQPTLKKENSYTYWVTDTNKSRELPAEHQPKKLEKPVEQVQTEQGPSAWNSCGTWEQKKIPFAQIKQGTTENLLKLITQQKWEVELGTVDLQGDAYKVFKKNKWNAIYEIKGTIEFKREEVKAKLKIQELSNMGDQDYQITGNSQIKKILQENVSALLQAITSVLAKHNT